VQAPSPVSLAGSARTSWPLAWPRIEGSHLAILASVAIVLVHATALVRNVVSSSHFVGDDLLAFHAARTLPLLDHLTRPIDVHFVPLHQAVSRALTWLAPGDFPAAVQVLVALHLASLLALFVALRKLAPSPLLPFVIAAYGCHVYLGSLLTWWSAGLHRLGHLLCASLAILGWSRFRERPTAGRGLHVIVACAAALGFYEKALLLPGTLLAIELCLYRRTLPSSRRAHLCLFFATLVTSVAYYFLSRRFVEPVWTELTRDVVFLAEHVRLSWIMLLRSTIGGTYTHTEVSLAVAAAFVAWTVARSRWNVATWAVGLTMVNLELACTGMSATRSRAWSHALSAFSHRYYTEAFFVLVVFVAMALSEAHRDGARADGRAHWTRPDLHTARVLLVATALTVVVSVRSSREWPLLGPWFYPAGPVVKGYMDRLSAELKAHAANGRAPVFVDGTVPRTIQPFVGYGARHSYLLTALGHPATFRPKGRGVYRIRDDGTIVAARRPRATRK